MASSLNAMGRVVLAALLLSSANYSSGVDYRWTGNAGDHLWGTPGNWDLGMVPTADAGNNAFVVNSNTPTIIPPGVTYSVGINSDHSATFGTVYGPEFGATLNIYGTLNFDWAIGPVQDNVALGARSIINMYSGSAIVGVNVCLGDNWWWRFGPYVTMNMYGDSLVNAENFWLGGHANVYDMGVMVFTNGVGLITDVPGGAVSDATRSMNLAGGKLILGTGFGAVVTDWITRGILVVYGKPQSSNDLVVVDDGTNTIVTTVSLGGSLQGIRFEPLARTSMMAGTFQQARLVADYPNVSGVLLSSEDPGLNLSVVGYPVYESSNPSVLTINSNGLISAVAPGTATVSATLDSFTSTNSISVDVIPVTASLVHRYSFSELSGTITADSIGGALWDGYLLGGATLGGGHVTLDGVDGSVLFTSGLISGLDELTIETWVTLGNPVNTFASLYAFGDQDGSGVGMNYLRMVPRTGVGTALASLGIGVGTANEQAAVLAGGLSGVTNMHIVVVYHPLAGNQSLYTNGVLAATYNNLTTPLAYEAHYGVTSVRYVLGTDPLNFIGQSLSSGDNYLNGLVDEFRIYGGPLSAAQVRADYLLGPDQLFGTSTDVTLTATVSGDNLVLTWPISSALVNLTSSSVVGSGAVWSPANGMMAVAGGNYQMTVPITGSAQFFRLE